MAYIACYTKPGLGDYPAGHFPGHTGHNCDWELALHLAWSEDRATFHPLRNNTGILFPKASYEEEVPQGVTKTMKDPWLCRAADGSFLVFSIRLNGTEPDPSARGAIQWFSSRDLIRYREEGFIRVAEEEIRAPACTWNPGRNAYRLTWQQGTGRKEGWTEDFVKVRDIRDTDSIPERAEQISMAPVENPSISDDTAPILPGNILEISEEELRNLRKYADVIRHVGNRPLTICVPAGTRLAYLPLPDAVCEYSDGSVHRKKVRWDTAALSRIDFTKPGKYLVSGEIISKTYPTFPISLGYGSCDPEQISDINMKRGMSDPCVTWYRGFYYLSSSGSQNITLRRSEKLEKVFSADPVIIASIPLAPGERGHGTWAAELHEIGGKLCLLTTICPGGDWTRVQSVILRCQGDPMDPDSWEAPRYCVDRNGGLISRRGISLDMTYFEDAGRHYVMWSNRLIYQEKGKQTIEPAEIDIAEIDPAHPWQLLSDPVCVTRPDYGWERMETEVDEGPYLLRKGNELLITISCSSTGLGDLYNIGLLRAQSGSDLLNPESWDKWPWPLLTKESVPGEFGPGHNDFVTDRETGETIMIYHAIPHGDTQDDYLRQPAMRRVHLAASGLPYLEMTPERDLNPELKKIKLHLEII